MWQHGAAPISQPLTRTGRQDRSSGGKGLEGVCHGLWGSRLPLAEAWPESPQEVRLHSCSWGQAGLPSAAFHGHPVDLESGKQSAINAVVYVAG